jgi:hypothetical protein
MGTAAGRAITLYSYLYDEARTSRAAQGSHEAAFLLRTSKVDHDARYGGNSREREES